MAGKRNDNHRNSMRAPEDQRRVNDRPDPEDILCDFTPRPIDGVGSVEDNLDWGAVNQTLLRLSPTSFEDGIWAIEEDLASAREISNAVAAQDEDTPNSFNVSDLFWVWGQFIDHDIVLTESGSTSASIDIPQGDLFFNSEIDMAFNRLDPIDGTGEETPAQYENEITAFIDASMVYGSDAETAAALRSDDGKLILDEFGLVDFLDDGSALAGDIRAAENSGLYSIQTLFAREHNWWVDTLADRHPGFTPDQLFDAARIRVEAEVQAITYNEYLSILLGDDAISEYAGYDASINPGISVEFATAAYRFGHSLVSATLERIEENGETIDAGNLSLRDAFFSTTVVAENGGIEPLLRGLADGTAQQLDTQVVDDLRNFLFSEDGGVGFDLVSFNIQRGRDMGLASYNDLREAVGLDRMSDFSDLTSDPDLAIALASVYENVDDVDAWVGGLAEDPSNGGMLGELFSTIVADQFMRLRDGDPFWSQNSDIPLSELDLLWDTSLADIIERNSDVDAIQDNALIAYNRIGGDEFDNLLEGDDDQDLILGQAGDDTLIGGGGNDQLEGGEGSDIFVFGLNSGIDFIKDFNTKEDLLDLTLYNLTDFKDVAIQEDHDIILTLGTGDVITLEDVHLRDLSSENFWI
ncbi:MAG: peroxidase family protein [Sneathiella sp.]